FHGDHPVRSGGAVCRLLVRGAVLARVDQRELARERRLRDGPWLDLATERATVHVEDYNGGKRHASHCRRPCAQRSTLTRVRPDEGAKPWAIFTSQHVNVTSHLEDNARGAVQISFWHSGALASKLRAHLDIGYADGRYLFARTPPGGVSGDVVRARFFRHPPFASSDRLGGMAALFRIQCTCPPRQAAAPGSGFAGCAGTPLRRGFRDDAVEGVTTRSCLPRKKPNIRAPFGPGKNWTFVERGQDRQIALGATSRPTPGTGRRRHVRAVIFPGQLRWGPALGARALRAESPGRRAAPVGSGGQTTGEPG
ncbi:hypothetical protein NP493_3340g00009, partial [Ridgeia piscesae]